MEQHSQQSLIFCKLQIYMQRIDSLLPQYDTLLQRATDSFRPESIYNACGEA